MKWLPSLLSVIMLVGGQSSREKPAPKPPDPRPAIIRKLTKSIARWENCPFNPGCLRSGNGYRRFKTRLDGLRAIEDWWWRHRGMKLRRALGIYNSANAHYADIILGDCGLDGDIVIGEWR